MPLLARLCLSATLLCHFAVQAETMVFDNIESFIASHLNVVPEKTLVARGDLNQDGRVDAAVLLVTQQSDNSGIGAYQVQLFLLTQEDSREYRIAARGKRKGSGYTDKCCSAEGLRIEKGSVYVASALSGPCVTQLATTQVKLIGAKWKPIGFTTTEYWLRCSSSGDRFQEVDANLLTGRFFEYSKIGQEPLERTSGKLKSEPNRFRDSLFDFSD